jgi:uncharacterized protein YuzE
VGSESVTHPVLTFDDEADAAYIRLAPFRAGGTPTQVVVEDLPVAAEIVLDFSPEGWLVGVEIIGARAVLRPELLAGGESP